MTLRLALLSTADINEKLVAGAREAENVEVVAIGSRDPTRARRQAGELNVPRALGSYEEVLADPGVDAVYIPLPNSLHVEWSVQALEAGKHVLCEKPLSRHPEEVERAFDAAERNDRVLAEAFMWRHHPQAAKLRELTAEVGEVRLGARRLLVPAAGGGERALGRVARRRRAHGRGLLLRVRRALRARRALPGHRPVGGRRRGRARGRDDVVPGRRPRALRLRVRSARSATSWRWWARRARSSSTIRGTRAGP